MFQVEYLDLNVSIHIWISTLGYQKFQLKLTAKSISDLKLSFPAVIQVSHLSPNIILYTLRTLSFGVCDTDDETLLRSINRVDPSEFKWVSLRWFLPGLSINGAITNQLVATVQKFSFWLASNSNKPEKKFARRDIVLSTGGSDARNAVRLIGQ